MWGGTDEAASIAGDPGLARRGRQPDRHRAGLRQGPGGGDRRQGDRRAAATRWCWPPNAAWSGIPTRGNHFFDYDGKPVHRYLGAESIAHELEQSLKRLGTDHIDLYITHWQDPTTPVAETMEALEKLKRAGQDPLDRRQQPRADDLEAYVAAGGLDAIQESTAWSSATSRRRCCRSAAAHGVSIAQLLVAGARPAAGRIGPDRTFDGDDQRKDNPRFSIANREKGRRLLSEIAPVAEAHGARRRRSSSPGRCSSPGSPSRCAARAIPTRRARTRRRALDSPGDINRISAAATRHLTDSTPEPDSETRSAGAAAAAERCPIAEDKLATRMRRDGACARRRRRHQRHRRVPRTGAAGPAGAAGRARRLLLGLQRRAVAHDPRRPALPGERRVRAGRESLRERDALLRNAPHYGAAAADHDPDRACSPAC